MSKTSAPTAEIMGETSARTTVVNGRDERYNSERFENVDEAAAMSIPSTTHDQGPNFHPRSCDVLHPLLASSPLAMGRSSFAKFCRSRYDILEVYFERRSFLRPNDSLRPTTYLLVLVRRRQRQAGGGTEKCQHTRGNFSRHHKGTEH
jgi:hypothetical protein